MRAVRLGLCLLLLSVPCAPGVAAVCELLPMDEQLQITELRGDDPSQAEDDYRRQLMHFVRAFYGNIAQDILRGEGEYLYALQRLMGSAGNDCVALYRMTLLQEASSRDFALALWSLRVRDAIMQSPATQAAQDWGAVSEMTQR